MGSPPAHPPADQPSPPGRAAEPAGRPLLIVADRVRTLDPDRPAARAVLVQGQQIVWVGDDPAEAPFVGEAHELRLEGAVLQPGFVDAHVHLTATGLQLEGLDLRDCRSVDDCLALIRAVADVLPGRVIVGSGWDDSDWPEHRPPTADELMVAGGGRPLLLTRADGHSAVADRLSLEAVPLSRVDGVERDSEGRPTGLLRREAHHVVWHWFLAALSEAQLGEARSRAARHAVGLGLTSAHEMGGPDLMGERDFDAWCDGDWPLEIVGYWGAPDLDFAAARGLRHIGGDIFLDGTLGSRTAALTAEYADARGGGHLYESTDDLAAFLAEAARRRIQVGLHCIGDAAVLQAIEVFEAAAAVAGGEAVRATRPRLEHCSFVPGGVPTRMARLGAVASVQPGFDRRWGARGGLYERRLGPERTARVHPLRELADAGVTLAFGSDSTVTPIDPWAMVDAAVQHHHGGQALDEQRALESAVTGGRAAARQRGVGRVRPGERADLVAFEGPDGRGRCVLTVVKGRVVHDPAGTRA